MSSAFPKLIAAAALFCAGTAAGAELKVCADPNNLPFSNDRREGFENKIVELVAEELEMELTYVWWPQRRGYIAEGLNTGACDLISGISRVPGVLLTYPAYYRSTYVFVTPAGVEPIASFDDPRLRTLTVGVQLIGGSDAGTPPAIALARRGIVDNVRGFSVVGDYTIANPPSGIIDAVSSGVIDVAIAWGPMASYFAAAEDPALQVQPVQIYADTPGVPMQFDISMALRQDAGALRKEVEEALDARRAEIDAILAAYHVPRVDLQGAPL